MNEDLIKAIWQSGWCAGHECGSDYASAFEHGARSHKPQKQTDAWEFFVANYPHSTIEDWKDIP
jgi:hypothetical protein